MALIPGTRLGAYEIVSALGAGGMGEVYRANDTRLKRQVAIKVLPGSFVDDPERLARFQREAELLAAVNHPHIAAVYGLEETDGIKALVMELVDGERSRGARRSWSSAARRGGRDRQARSPKPSRRRMTAASCTAT